MDWAYILVILLAVLFAIFLAVAITLIVLILRITQQIKQTTASAQRTIASLEGSVNTFKKASLPLMMTKGVMSQIVRRTKKKGHKE